MTPEEKLVKVESLKTQFQDTLDNPCQASAEDILGCFFGTKFDVNSNNFEDSIKEGHCIWDMKSLWFSGSPLESYDGMCRSMIAMIEKAASQELGEWNSSVNGRMAQMILFDQVSRNAFRRTNQAFAYDTLALEHARVLTRAYLGQGDCTLEGVFYPPFLMFMSTPFIHSEEIEDHKMALELLDCAKDKTPHHLQEWWKMVRKGAVAHMEVIQRFGRYPHRNRSLGRTNTPGEEAYLADVDNLPSWARSQV
ncbi:Bacterial protein of unknown function (DUF924) [Seminavis robusta]|uniref:Uncharacterized protein n=1 Tax=Seminavis robusta TaxID=568900 RepID=A0A9N8EZS4_9STRA|nr:Bacterial protein of unknown function (DUF924) [Seminavis robusta]|eukprot:Sro2055_g312780.1 Bacterial protein of unknown function (DUF924) (251) ;mRNA; r:3428-4180